jgi:hypothetical protein
VWEGGREILEAAWRRKQIVGIARLPLVAFGYSRSPGMTGALRCAARACGARKEFLACLPSSYPFSAQARLGPRWANLSSRLTALHFSGWRASSFPLRSNVDFLSPLCCSRISTPPREARDGTLGLQQQGRIFFFAYPALIPQRGSAPRKCDRATIGRPWRGWSIADERLFR